jgi:hypothetical protein
MKLINTRAGFRKGVSVPATGGHGIVSGGLATEPVTPPFVSDSHHPAPGW